MLQERMEGLTVRVGMKVKKKEKTGEMQWVTHEKWNVNAKTQVVWQVGWKMLL